jgi:tetratricopeptide (TPR) repeat protein
MTEQELQGLPQEELVAKGLEAISHGHFYLAMNALEMAINLQKTSVVASYLAYCQAMNQRDLQQAIALGEWALGQEPNNPVFCLNLGRVYLVAGQKTEAVRVFRQGLAFTRDQEIIDELDRLGTRKKALFPALDRDNPLNKWGGKLLSSLGLR